jgi:hypothetical protein
MIDLTDDQRKGIDMVMKNLMRKFPFITDYQLNKNSTGPILWFAIQTNWIKLAEYSGYPVPDYYDDFNYSFLQTPFIVAYRKSNPKLTPNEEDETTMDIRKYFDDLQDRLNDYINQFYEVLPKEYASYHISELVSNHTYRKELRINYVSIVED